jgi:hypothetical protein
VSEGFYKANQSAASASCSIGGKTLKDLGSDTSLPLLRPPLLDGRPDGAGSAGKSMRLHSRSHLCSLRNSSTPGIPLLSSPPREGSADECSSGWQASGEKRLD